MSLAEFLSAIDCVRIAQSHDEHQPVLNSIYLSMERESIVLAATDGHRVAETQLPTTSGQASVAVVVPARSVSELPLVFGFSDRVLDIGVSPRLNRIRFQSGPDFVESGLVEGTFPDYRKVRPTGPATVVVVGRLDLTLALRACEVFARAGTNPVSLTAHAGGIKVSGQSTELGKNVANVDAEVSGPQVTVSVSGQYLLDGLVILTGDMASLEIRDQRTPVVLRPIGQTPFWYAVAPRLPLPESGEGNNT
jgi:DNA polymerase-3 subunit beta